MSTYAQQILEIVYRADTHPTAEQIFLELKRTNPRIAQATVYNNLKTLTGAGRLTRIATSGRPDRYDRPDPHAHLICTQCGALLDVDIGDFTGPIEDALGYPVESCDIIIHALCPRCRGASEKK